MWSGELVCFLHRNVDSDKFSNMKKCVVSN
jgi:hypothetical protein